MGFCGYFFQNINGISEKKNKNKKKKQQQKNSYNIKHTHTPTNLHGPYIGISISPIYP